MFSARPLVLALGLSVAALAAHATDVSTTFQVTATVTDNCTVSATNLAFGNYASNSASDVDGQSTISVNCSLATAYSVGLNAGTAPGASVSSRAMVQGANTLPYALYRNSGRTLNWGEALLDRVTASGTGATVNHPVYGRIAAGAAAAPGAYADQITVTVTY